MQNMNIDYRNSEYQNNKMVSVEDYLSHVFEVISNTGWTSASYSKEFDMESTSDAAFNHFNSNANNYNRLYNKVSGKSKLQAKKALQWVSSLNDGKIVRNEYLKYAKSIAQQNKININEVKKMASLAACYIRYIKYKDCQYVGYEGDNYIFKNLFVEKILFITYDDAVKCVHVMKDNNGDYFVWKTNRKYFNENTYISIEGKVKKHEEYYFCKQTILSHCREIKG